MRFMITFMAFLTAAAFVVASTAQAVLAWRTSTPFQSHREVGAPNPAASS